MPDTKLGTCDTSEGHTKPHVKTPGCVNWREQPAQAEPPLLTNPVIRKAYESGVDTGFKVGQMNPDQIKWWFDEREAAVIDEIAKKQELSRQAVLRQALRTYQLIVMGTHELKELNPMPKMAEAGPVEGMSAVVGTWIERAERAESALREARNKALDEAIEVVRERLERPPSIAAAHVLVEVRTVLTAMKEPRP